MKPILHFDGSLSPKEAVALQRTLAERVVKEPLETEVDTIAGVDVSVRIDRVRTAVVVIAVADRTVVEEVVWEGPVTFPYIPGLLSFREIPAIIPALNQLDSRPDLLMMDGQGRAHPRRFGLACHVGVLYDIPALGVAKSRLVGSYEEPGRAKGAYSPLLDGDDQIGWVVRTRTDVKPVFSSAGHRISTRQALELTLLATDRYKIPEPTRLAHLLSKEDLRSRGRGD